MMKPFTETSQSTLLSSMRLGKVHVWSKGRSFSVSRMVFSFAAPVLSLTPKAALISFAFM